MDVFLDRLNGNVLVPMMPELRLKMVSEAPKGKQPWLKIYGYQFLAASISH